MRQGAGFFLTTKFPMRDRDVVFVANAETVNSAKFLQFVRLIVATANDGLVVANNTQVLRINSRQ